MTAIAMLTCCHVDKATAQVAMRSAKKDMPMCMIGVDRSVTKGMPVCGWFVVGLWLIYG
jgi:hypothetical protein